MRSDNSAHTRTRCNTNEGTEPTPAIDRKKEKKKEEDFLTANRDETPTRTFAEVVEDDDAAFGRETTSKTRT